MEGRDIGTVVFPQAQLKIFLKADVEERARRRLKQDSREGREATLEKTAYEIGRRDQLDAERKISPLIACGGRGRNRFYTPRRRASCGTDSRACPQSPIDVR